MIENTLEIPTTETQTSFPTISPVTDRELMDYLHQSYQFAEIAAAAEEQVLIVKLCQHFGIEISDAEWQQAGDAFRLKHKLWGVKETNNWLEQQRISLEDWSEGIKIQLLTQKLKEHLFGANVDNHYISNRDRYQRIALSQILVLDRPTADEIMRSLSAEPTSFCALALQHSQGKQSHTNGGFLGVLYLSQLAPEIANAVAEAPSGIVVEPIQTAVGYHILRVEQRFPPSMNESVRNEILNNLWRIWLKEQV